MCKWDSGSPRNPKIPACHVHMFRDLTGTQYLRWSWGTRQVNSVKRRVGRPVGFCTQRSHHFMRHWLKHLITEAQGRRSGLGGRQAPSWTSSAPVSSALWGSTEHQMRARHEREQQVVKTSQSTSIRRQVGRTGVQISSTPSLSGMKGLSANTCTKT